MSTIVAEGVVVIDADAKGVGREITKQIEAGSSDQKAAGVGVGKSVFGGVVAGFAAVGGAQIVTDFFVGAIKGSSDLTETMSKSSTIFGDQAGAIEAWAGTADTALGLSKASALEAAAGFGNMFTQLGFAGDQAATMSQSVVQAAADLGSFNNLETGDVADRMSAAFRGEYDSLQALIPNINAARVESEAMAATGKKNAAELTAQEKAAAVLAIVQKDGAAAMGDFAKTADGAANTQKTLTASMEDQQAKLGTTLMPLWQGFLGFLTDTAIPVLSSIIDFIAQNASWLGPLALAIGVATGAVWAFNIALNANPIMLIITGIGLLVGALIWVATQTTFFQDTWENVTGVIVDVWEGLVSFFTDMWNNLMSFFGTWGPLILAIIAPVIGIPLLIMQHWEEIVGFFGWLGDQIAGIFKWLYESAIKPPIDAIGAAFRWIWDSVISPVVKFITGAIDNVGRAVRTVFGGIASFMGSAFTGALNIIRGPINGIISLVNQAIKGINSLSVTIPDWVPLVGGQTWGLDIPTIPMLAKGGVLRSGGSVMVGEAGPEILDLPSGARVTPLDRAGAGSPLIAGDLNIYEAQDPLGTTGRVEASLRKWRKH